MPKHTVLTRKVDAHQLEQLLKHEARRRIRERLQAILWIAEGELALDVARKIGRCRQAVAGYVRLFNQHGVAGVLEVGRGPGRQSRLSPAQKRRLLRWIEQGPQKLGLGVNLWDCKRLAHQVKKQWGVTLTDERVRQILHQAGATLLRPKHKLPAAPAALRAKKNSKSRPFWRWPIACADP